MNEAQSKEIRSKLLGKWRWNRRLMTFFVCLFISIFFWLLMSLSKDYVEVIRFPVRYDHSPEDRVVSNELPANIDVEVSASGFSLLRYLLFSDRETLSIDMRDARPFLKRNHYYLDPNSRLDKIIGQFGGRLKINQISPDTIFLNFNKRMSKLVPIHANITVDCAPQFQMDDTIQLLPAAVLISGSADVLDKIDSIDTEPLQLKDLKESTTVQLKLLPQREGGTVDYAVDSCMAHLNVQKFTEGSLLLPIQVLNLPEGYSLKTFPDKIEVKYTVSLANFEHVDPAQFLLAVDYTKIAEGSNKLKVQMVKAPKTVRNIRLDEEKVEYLIRR